MKTVAFFNNKGGVGKTSLVFHLAWILRDFGCQVIAADFDPQANLTSAFLDEERLEAIWPDEAHDRTVFGCLQPLIRGTGDIEEPHIEEIDNCLGLLVGDLALSRFEDELSNVWPSCLEGKERAFRVTSAFWRIMDRAARATAADVILIDVGPNLGAINRSALIAADFVVVPLAPDLFSLQGLRNLGPTLKEWRDGWKMRRDKNPDPEGLQLPSGEMRPIGYIVLQHAVRLDRPVKAYEKWISRIPLEYRNSVLGEQTNCAPSVNQDPHCLSLLKHYRSLMPLAQEALKPVFHLTPADGAIGAHQQAAQDAYDHFKTLARRIAEDTPVSLELKP